MTAPSQLSPNFLASGLHEVNYNTHHDHQYDHYHRDDFYWKRQRLNFDSHFEPSAPFVRVVLRSKSLGLSYPLGVHIDTGSSVTIVFDRDVELLGVNVSKLKRAERNVSGVGGTVDTYVVDDAELLFRTGDGKIRVEKLRLYVGRHDLTELSEAERDMIMLVPSLFGSRCD